MTKKDMPVKEDRNVSHYDIYSEAIRNYTRQKEINKWERGIEKALKDPEYSKFIQEIGNT